MGLLSAIFLFLRAVFRSRAAIADQNLALRQQLDVLRRSGKRPRLRQGDRVFWVWLSRLWADWQSSLVIVKPETVKRGTLRLWLGGGTRARAVAWRGTGRQRTVFRTLSPRPVAGASLACMFSWATLFRNEFVGH